jgi:molybdate/tungstate transport system ATP-binding protein
MTLDLDGLAKSYGGFELGPVDLSVGEEVLSVLGPSGCGKTTLLWLVAGLASPDAGSVSLGGRSLDGEPPEHRRTGLVFQDGALFPNMTVGENIAYASTDDEYVAELAALFELEGVLDRRPRTLSGGERQRVALARTLATEPDALLLDEPLSSLDAPIRRRLRTELYDLFGSLAIPVVLVTHDQRTATALGDRIAVMRDGRVEQVGSPADVIDRPESRFVAGFTGNENVFEAAVRGRDERGVHLRVGDVTLLARTGGEAGSPGPVGGVVTACIHPSRVRLAPPVRTSADGDATVRDTASADGDATVRDTASADGDATVRDTASADGDGVILDGDETVLAATVHHWLNEGDEYRVVVGVDGTGLEATATVSPPAFDRLAVEVGASVRAVVSPAAVHLIESREGTAD